MHVTVRLRQGLPSLRAPGTRAALEERFAAGASRFGFRLVHYSIQSTHIHLLAEATDRRALWRGMQGLLVRIARGLNRTWNRKGKVFADRYHARQLRSPREVRNALVYVLQNARRHGLEIASVDPYSSGPWFLGWAEPHNSPARAAPTVPARTWLLRSGWRRHGRISVLASPRPRPP